jgi:hypothetical protein
MYIFCSFAYLGIEDFGSANLGKLGVGLCIGMSSISTLRGHFVNFVLTMYSNKFGINMNLFIGSSYSTNE